MNQQVTRNQQIIKQDLTDLGRAGHQVGGRTIGSVA